VLFVLVDDLGWGDVGFHNNQGKKSIKTPTIDRLAQEQGLILNRHYVHSSCTGTRVSLQSGRLPVHVQTSLKLVEDPSSGMPRNMTGLAEHLQQHAAPVQYRTHYVGKWDVGMATPKHTPYGRGYDTSLHYFEHKNDYWTQHCMQSACCPNYGLYHNNSNGEGQEEIPDFWEAPRPQHNYNLSLVDLWDTLEPAKSLNGTDYEEFLFLDRMKSIIRNHTNAESDKIESEQQQPLFLFYAPHVAHCPLQVPQAYLDKFDDDDFSDDETVCRAQTPRILGPNATKDANFSCRKQYHAMVNVLDDILASLVEELEQAGLWNDTLLIFTSDNGGPTKLEESGSTNFDLRGGKYSDWEGGVRAVAFVSGGYLPEDRRGMVLEEPVHITDWYATLPALAGITHLDDDSQGGRYPPIDALNLWPVLSGTETRSPRQEIPLSKYALIQGDYKLLWNTKRLVDQSGWTGPIYPNATSSSSDIFVGLNCKKGCLFNVANDRGEHMDLAKKMPVRVQAMKKRLVELRKGFYENDDKGDDSCPNNDEEGSSYNSTMPCACWMAINYYGGYLGPFQEVDTTTGTTTPAAPVS
jgi:arylsulfatase A-like enzyme